MSAQPTARTTPVKRRGFPALLGWGYVRGAWVVLVLGAALMLLARPVEEVVLELRAPKDAAAEFPVFGSRVVRQTFQLREPRAIDRLLLPVRLPTAGPAELTLTLEANGEPRAVHSMPLVAGLQDVALRPGRHGAARAFVLTVAVPAVTEPGEAPRVFFEPSEESYPAGELSVSGKSKEGNIALRALIRRPAIAATWEQLRADPGTAGGVLQRAALLVLLLALPWILLWDREEEWEEDERRRKEREEKYRAAPG